MGMNYFSCIKTTEISSLTMKIKKQMFENIKEMKKEVPLYWTNSHH